MPLRGLPDRPGYSQHVPAMYSTPLPLRAVSLRRCLRDRRRDPVSGVPLGPASAALRYLLPVYDLERNTPASTGPLQETIDGLALLKDAPVACHVTGSSIERLSVPPYTEREGGEGEVPHYRVADIDMMVELKQLKVAARRGAGIIYMDTTRASHRGYTRVIFDAGGLTLEELAGMPAGLCFKTAEDEEEEEEGDEGEQKENEEKQKKEQKEEEKVEGEEKEGGTKENEENTGENEEEKTGVNGGRKEEEGGAEGVEKKADTKRSRTLYLSIDAVNTHLAAQVQAVTPGAEVHRQGPAINVQELKESRRDSPGGAHSYIEDCDLVPALPLSDRPPELSVWLERVRGRSWPPESLRAEMESSSRCFLVGAGHASSARRDLEWRLSFSEPERRLALSLTPQQRKVYVLIKMMQKCYLQQPKVLVTYHIKTLMFWELEECSDTDWLEEELFQHVLNMLDRITACLERQYIPSYFMPDNNLISHAPAEDVAAVLETVRKIRRQPLQHLYGIDERFRFDFSAPRPLSELHEPLREAITARTSAGDKDEDGGDGDGGGCAVAEALVLSLISQAQTDVQRGLSVLKHCARLLRDAWEALAAAGPEDAPHPVHEDWAVFAAAAVLTSMEAAESAHLMLAVRMAVDDEKRPTAHRQLTEDEALAASTIMAPMLGGSEGGPLGQIVRQVGASGAMEEPSAVVQMLSVRHAQLELLRDLKNRAQEQVTGLPPMSAAITSARLQLGLIELTYRMQLKTGTPEPEARLQLISQTLPMTQGLMLGGGSGGGGGAESGLLGMVNQALAGLGIPAELQTALAPELGQLSQHLGQLSQQLGQLSQQLAPPTAQPIRLPYENDPRTTALIPLDMINVFHHCTIGQGLGDEVVDLRYTAFLNMIGFFLKHRRYLFAFRMVGRITCLRLVALEAEMTRSVYQLTRAPLYLQQLPDPVRRLLHLSSSRAAIGVIYYFIDFVHLTLDWTLMTELTVRPAEDLAKMEKLMADAEPFSSPDVSLTHQLMMLVVLRILNRDTTDCLQRVAELAGTEVAEAAAAALAGWSPPAEPTTETVQETAEGSGTEERTGGTPRCKARQTDAPAPHVRNAEAVTNGTVTTGMAATEVSTTEATANGVPATDVPAAREEHATEAPAIRSSATEKTALLSGEKPSTVPDSESSPNEKCCPGCCRIL